MKCDTGKRDSRNGPSKRRARNAHTDSNVRINQPVIFVRDAHPTGTVPRSASYLVRGNACLKSRMGTALQADAFNVLLSGELK
jgi:hypothetical protein